MTEELKQCLRNVILHYMFCDQEEMELAVSAVLASQGMGKPFKLLFEGIEKNILAIKVIFSDESKQFRIIIKSSAVDFSDIDPAEEEFANLPEIL